MTNEIAFKWSGSGDSRELKYVAGEGPEDGFSCPICAATDGRMETTFLGRGVPNNFWEQWRIECFDCGQRITLLIEPPQGTGWLTDFRLNQKEESEGE